MHIDFDKFQASLDDIGEEQTAINEYKLLRARDVLIVAQRNLRHMAIELASHKDTDEQQGRADCVRLNRMAEELTFAMQQMIANHYGVTI